ncbi:hypothetical protein W97_01919 [Coniosporium apollinis CBS 100218]|uniref:Ig-like domain-containing protein n=1 Tax=Coniosporium apollinis (strain CBS 100218) TaxID=1168221 RepID=R7YLB6_CONA1|nr:uncharacterized protein W97_01919 [Coniosporium apollinis CBS 100218]EON62695.1 hypothetical protein W97_01919 [Coniosporium apollinis CBS 100218]
MVASWFHRLTFLLLCIQSAVSQQSQTVSLLDLGISGLVASVITADATATTYKLDCPSNDPTNCGYESGYTPTVTAVGGPSTAAMTDKAVISGTSVAYTYACDVTNSESGTASGSCSYTGTSGGVTATTTGSLSARDTYIPIVVTAGLEKLLNDQGASSSPTPTGSATAQTSVSSPAESPTRSTTAQTSVRSTTESATESAAAQTSNGSAPVSDTVHVGGAVAWLAGVLLAAL